jgi:uracil-DNA glycosylase family 4
MKINAFWGAPSAITEDCEKCGLYKKCQTPFTKSYGEGKLKVLFVTGKPENDKGVGLSGKTISSITERFSEFGFNVERNSWKTSAVECYTKDVTENQINHCRSMLEGEIKRLSPKYIIPVGATACKSVIGHMFRMPSVETLCFRKIPVPDYNAWVIPILNPSNFKTPNENSYFSRLVKWILKEIKKDEKLVKVNPFEKVEVCSTFKSTVKALNWLLDQSDIETAFDIETTGLKPQYEEHCVTSMAIATKEKTIAFPLDHPEAGFTDGQYNQIQELVSEYCGREDLKKIAHNIQFDTMWAETFFEDVKGWLHCTRTNQHLFDHRTGAKGLKDLAFLHWGIRDYNDKARMFIESDPPGAKGLNKMREMPLHEQLLYVGADAYLTLKLDDLQSARYAELDNEKKYQPRLLFLESNRTLCTIQQNGIPVDTKYYKLKEEELDGQIEMLEKELSTFKEIRTFQNLFRKPFEHSKAQDLKRLLFNVLKFDKQSLGTTESGEVSFDEKSLKELDHPICGIIVSLRKLYKIRDTYLSQFIREEVNGRIHPFFNLSIVRSYRSSSNSPNFQNIPKRDEYAKKVTRRGLITEKGGGTGEIDFSGIEVCTSAAYHQDPTFIQYLTEDGADMHRDNTCDLWLIPQKQVVKMLRFYTKNQWTFPQFYGDYFGSCAPQLWETCINKEKFKLTDGTPLIEHIRSKGIKTMEDFTEHCKDVEDKMWNQRFPVYTKWKKDINDFYCKHGYVETYLGFRYTGLLNKKQTTNYPIQGTAFHILLWSLNRIQAFITKEKLRSYICGQIHDSCIFQWFPEERDYLLDNMKKICSVDVLKEFKWINVPFSIDVELSEIDGNFSEMSTYVKKGDTWIKEKG